MKKYLFILPILVIVVVLVSGCATTPYDGSPPKLDQSRINVVTASASTWLSGPQGLDMFSNGVLAAPIPIFTVNRTFDHWILPVKDGSGMYIGFFLSDKDNFTVPDLGATKYSYSRHNLFSKTSEDAYNEILTNTSYTADQVNTPYVITVPQMGYYWASDVVINGKFITQERVAISTIEPSNADRTVGSA